MGVLTVLFAPLLGPDGWLSGLFLPSPPSPVDQQLSRLTLAFDIVRADDLLAFHLDGYNLELDPAGKHLKAVGPGNSFIILRFPGQNIAEQAFAEAEAPAPPPVGARLAAPSQLVFAVPVGALPLAFSVDAILGALSTAATLVGDRTGGSPLSPPLGGTARFGGVRSLLTEIEAPWRLRLSPHPDARWAHAPLPKTQGGKVELWHTRLGVVGAGGVDEVTADKRTARAIASPDFAGSAAPAPTATNPFLMSLTRQDRHELVRLSSERSLDGNAPVAVHQLLLSALGASSDLHGSWDTDEISLIDWQNRATIGRDQFSQTVRKGFLFPLGHRVKLVTITERKLAAAPDTPNFDPDAQQGEIAYLRQRVFITIREPVKLFNHRALPFRSVTIRTKVTPNLRDPGTTTVQKPPHSADAAFWPRHDIDGADILFDVTAVDWQGIESHFSVPQAFVFDSAAASPKAPAIVAAYNGVSQSDPSGGAAVVAVVETDPRRQRDMGGQRIAFAPQQVPGDTALDTGQLTFGALEATGTPPFLPAMRGAAVAVPAVRKMTGSAAPRTIRYDKQFLAAAADTFGNAGEVFAHIEAAAKIGFAAEKVGGLVAPDLTPQGLSRAFGPVGDVDAFVSGSFDPGKIFAGIQILGGIPLDKIFQKIPFGFPGQAGATVPSLNSLKTLADLGSGPLPAHVTHYGWSLDKAQLAEQPIFTPLDGSSFALDATIVTPLDGTAPSFAVSGKLSQFEITLPPGKDALIGAVFTSVGFKAGSGRKVDVAVEFNEIRFEGPLSFVNTIRKYIPLDGFVDPPYLDVSADGISAGYTLGIPTIGIGIFVLQDISLSAGFHLPFVGGAAGLHFAFCERDHPFLLTVMAFGGGGYFGLDLDTKGVNNVEASLEFGAAIAINLGIAAGAASITGGVYYQKTGAGFQITAFFRASGSLSVLGLVTVSVELYVGLGFESDKSQPHGGHLFGTASVKVKIKIAFFSKTVSVSIEREFAGSDPSFATMVSQSDWSEYCGAFAAEGP